MAMKYENGKRRFLYPTDIIDYVIETFTIVDCEPALNSLGFVGLPGDCDLKL